MIKINKKLFFGMIVLVFGIFILTSFVSAYVQSYYSSQNNNAMGLGSFSGGQSLRIDESMCQQGTDFVMQIGPLSCTPTVVRSDLLEEENVNVFCQLTATQINPFVDVKNIRWITFNSEKPREVLSLGYSPAQAALGYTQTMGLQGSAVLNNLGYVVVTLKQQPNESALTNCKKGALGSEVCWVEGNLTASLTYDVQNAFGVGSAVFYLPMMSDSDWQKNYVQYGFWDGRGYLRASAVGENDASVTIYSDSSIASGLSKGNREYNLAAYNSNIKLVSGTPSNKIFLPGLSPCLASLKLNLDGIQNPDTRASLKVNGDYFEVAEGEKFLDNKCTVSSINKKGISSEVTVRCSGADTTNERLPFILRVFPKVNLTINGKYEIHSVGDWLYKSEDGTKSVYLGYVGTLGDTNNVPKDLYVYTVALPVDEEKLTDSEISSVASHAELVRATSKTGAKTVDGLVESLKKTVGVAAQGFKWAVKGEAFNAVFYNEKSESTNVEGTPILLNGLASPEDNAVIAANAGNTGIDNYIKNYNDAMSNFNTVIKSFPKEVENANSPTLGEQSLYKEIELASAVGNKKTVADLCNQYSQDYPVSYLNVAICKDSLKLSNTEQDGKEITINGITKLISFDEVKEPSVEQYSATVLVQGPNGNQQSFDLRKNQQVPLDEFRTPDEAKKLQTAEYIMLTSLGTNTADIKINVGDKSFFAKQFESNTETLTKGISKKIPAEGGYTFTVTNIRLEKVAKISIIPSTDFAESNTTFKFKIGIEKRSDLLKLSPAKAQEKIDSLNDSIDKWQKASDTLYTVVKDMKAACMGAGAVLTFKNLIDNYGGKAIARQRVMGGLNGKGGWDQKCTALYSSGQYPSMDACFLDHSEDIDAEVNAYSDIMDAQNQEIKQIENANMLGTGLSAQVNTAALVKQYSANALDALNSLSPEQKKDLNIADLETIITPKGWEDGKYTMEQLKEIELYSLYIKSGADDGTAKATLNSVILDIENNAKQYVIQTNFQTETKMGDNSLVGTYNSLIKMKEIPVSSRVQFKDTKYPSEQIETLPGVTLDPTNYAFAVKDLSPGGKNYLVLYDNDGKVTNTYEITNVGGIEKLLISKKSNGDINQNPLDLFFTVSDATSYKNKYESSYGSSKSGPLLKYYEDSPYKGFPSVVPFDTTNGWYAGIKSPQTSYDSSGRVVSFWICNVGKNKIEEFQLEGFGDDKCELFNLNTGQKYTQFSGLSADDTYALVTKADNAIQSAQRAYKQGVTSVSINNKNVNVGTPTVLTPATQCTDFMSPKDCSLLFNLCDPVLCPSSRCNLGGNYPVKDVVQSGIIGSLALCYPNAKWNGGDVYVPVCLTGVQAGLDNWISVEKSYRDCLQTGVDTGQTVGICDEINSIYMCEFFWKQALPIIKSSIPKLLGALTGQNKKGGGEYQGITSALETAKSSIDYFKQYYAASSYRAFQVRSTEQVGTEVCGTFASLVYPDSGNFLDNLIEPDSPVQFTGKFSEDQLTTQTNPPTSHYKVYYNIYAGKDSGVYYQVYLRGAGSSYYQDTSQNRMVKSSYIERGGYASETVDFTSPSGYQQLCIVVNGQEQCGFKEVSTSFAVNYLNDLYLAEQATVNVTTEKECISGTSSFYSLLNLNAEEAANNLLNPAIYTQGIIRICATDNPGAGTDASAGTENARWKKMGYCGDSKVGCWIDTESVKNVIKTMSVEKSALNSISNNTLQYLSSDYLTDAAFKAKIDEIKNEKSDISRLNLIQEIFDKVFFNNQKAQLFFWRGVSYSNLAVNGYQTIVGIKEFPCRHFCGDDGNVHYGTANPDTGICSISNLIQKNCKRGCNADYGICNEDLSLNGTNTIPPTGIQCRDFCGTIDINVYYGVVNFDTGLCEKSNLIKKECKKGCSVDYGICTEDLSLGGNAGLPTEFMNYVSPEFVYSPNFLNANLHLRYDKEWYFCIGDITHLTNFIPFTTAPCTDSANWHKVSEMKTLVTASTHQEILDIRNSNLYTENYKDGLKYLMDKAKKNGRSISVSGDGFNVEMVSDGSFVLDKGSNSIDLMFRNGDWVWEAHGSIIAKSGFDPWSFTFTPVLQSHFCGYCESSIGACTPNLKKQIDKECALSKKEVVGFEILLPRLKSLDSYTGSKLLFEFFVSGIPETELNPSGGSTGGTGGTTTTTCTSGDTKCTGTTSYNCVNSVWVSKGLIDGKCGYLMPLRQTILTEAQSLDGSIVPQGYLTDCSTAVSYIYKEASAGLSNCVYSAKSGQKYNVVLNGVSSTVTMGTQTKIVNGVSTPIFLTADSCTYDSDNLAYADMLKNILPGDRIDFVYDGNDPHGVIFINWVVGEEYKTARVFDWNGNIINGIKTDSLGKVCTAKDYYTTSSQYCKSYRYTNYDLSIDKHTVYRIWNPVSV